MEIKPQELRIGNLVSWNKEPCTVQSIRGKDIGLYDQNKALICTTTDLIKGIELTPEWLEKFGAIRTPRINKETLAIIIDSETAIEYRLEPWVLKRISLTIAQEDAEMIINRIEKSIDLSYVHQLQNLYFALTGKELAIDKQN